MTATNEVSKHFVIISLGCGYYSVNTRFDVFGRCEPIHRPDTRMGTTMPRCRRIMRDAEAEKAAPYAARALEGGKS